MKRKKGLSPIIDQDSKILILGTFPSQSSRETKRYYENKNNRFWKVICDFIGITLVPEDYNEKVKLLLKNNIAVWDLIDECETADSKDSSIDNPVFHDLKSFLAEYPSIEFILLNGMTTTQKMYKKHFKDMPIPFVAAQSTSSASGRLDETLWNGALLLKSPTYKKAVEYYVKLLCNNPPYKKTVNNNKIEYKFNDYALTRTCTYNGICRRNFEPVLLAAIQLKLI